MDIFKDTIDRVLNSLHRLEYSIEDKPLDKQVIRGKLFIEALKSLKQIEDRRDFMESEIGMDMTIYEDHFMLVIENLFQLAFSQQQVALVQLYLYDLIPDKEWDGKITIENEGKEASYPFRTPEEVWEVIKKYEE